MSASAAQSLRVVFRAQQDRTTTYTTFAGALDTLLEVGDFAAYREACTNITAAFAALSTTIRDVEQSLVTLDHRDLGASVRRIQEAERDKLRLTARLHVVLAKQKFPAEESDAVDGDDTDEEGELRTSIAELEASVCSVLEDLHAELADMST